MLVELESGRGEEPVVSDEGPVELGSLLKVERDGADCEAGDVKLEVDRAQLAEDELVHAEQHPAHLLCRPLLLVLLKHSLDQHQLLLNRNAPDHLPEDRIRRPHRRFLFLGESQQETIDKEGGMVLDYLFQFDVPLLDHPPVDHVVEVGASAHVPEVAVTLLSRLPHYLGQLSLGLEGCPCHTSHHPVP